MPTKKKETETTGVRVRFLAENNSARGHFFPGDETIVAPRRAQIWAEGQVVEIVGPAPAEEDEA
jgi:hypothetical protein